MREIKKLSKFTKKQLSTYVTEIVKKIDKIVIPSVTLFKGWRISRFGE